MSVTYNGNSGLRPYQKDFEESDYCDPVFLLLRLLGHLIRIPGQSFEESYEGTSVNRLVSCNVRIQNGCFMVGLYLDRIAPLLKSLDSISSKGIPKPSLNRRLPAPKTVGNVKRSYSSIRFLSINH